MGFGWTRGNTPNHPTLESYHAGLKKRKEKKEKRAKTLEKAEVWLAYFRLGKEQSMDGEEQRARN